MQDPLPAPHFSYCAQGSMLSPPEEMINPFHMQTEQYGLLAILWTDCIYLGGALSWGHTVQRFGSNPDLGNAVQCISLSGKV